ncbi:Por secretion system C-terminal sorting domain-containing protein [Catalinimonas alkaloidigena]|uniref:Por secretion system C-terminal sorting domain-containing protein n=2 Tax=Catalinimonas alkaloidigena TaxID=1075417 RepID=A0A1G8YCL6_9BACT|nr:Por secretion system C-terminal sorting domain-containing protein [Catalinimonas alkaloidigena]
MAKAIFGTSVLFASTFLPLTAHAQDRLYGTTTDGGQGAGTLFSSNTDGSDFRVEYAFPDLGSRPADRPVQASNHLFYSVTTLGGNDDLGTIVRTSAAGDPTLLHAFAPAEGQAATGLTEGGDGALYGMTKTAFYRITFDGSFSVQRTFTPEEGLTPHGSLIVGDDGYFYGSASEGGAYGLGTLFRLRPDGSGFEKLHDMTADQGGRPVGSLFALDGYLYGAARGTGVNGSAASDGSVFRLKFDGTAFEVLHTLEAQLEQLPIGGLVQAANGYLYGVLDETSTFDHEYIIYKLLPDGTAYTTLASPSSIDNYSADVGQSIMKSLTPGPDGLLYGFIENLDAYDQGGEIAFFRLESNDTFTVLSNDAYPVFAPVGSLARGNDGYLYGLSDTYLYAGPVRVPGALFRISTSVAPPEEVHLLGAHNGANGDALTLTLVGEYLYGACREGGRAQGGTLFRFHLPTRTFEKLHEFTGASTHPGGKLAIVDDQLYGIVARGPARDLSSFGHAISLYHVDLDGSNFVEIQDVFELNDLTESTQVPWTGLIFGSDGSFYIPNGGLLDPVYGYPSSIVKASLAGSSAEEIATFSYDRETYVDSGELTAPEGFEPHELLEGSDGFLYALMNLGGENYDPEAFQQRNGTIVKVAKDGSLKQVLHSFNTTDGDGPVGGLIEGPGNTLYGMTRGGGTNHLGTVFSIKTDGSGFQKLYDFSATSGGAPVGSLSLGSDGYLYGMAREEGSYDYGTLFRLMTDGSGFQKLHDFTLAEGILPQGALVLTGDDATPDVTLAFEAECAEAGAHWLTSNSTMASNGAYAYGNASHFSPTNQPQDRLRFTVNTSTADAYTLTARVRAIGSGRNSFWVRLNDGAWQRWDLPVGNDYQWVELPFSGTTLASGLNTLDLEFREAYTQFDKLVVTNAAAPAGLGPEATNCNTPAPVAFSVYYEAECAEVGDSWVTSSSTLAAHDAYVYGPASHYAATGQAADRVRFRFDAPQADDYTLSARVRAIGSGRNSFWVRLNDGAWQRWDLPVGNDYQWVELPFSGSPLSKGSHTLDVEFRESYTQLDQIFITNTNEVPLGKGTSPSTCAPPSTRLSPDQRVAVGVYPNPTRGRFTLSAAEMDLSQAQIQVTTLEGRLLPQVPVKNQGAACEIDLSGQPSGVYLIKTITPDQTLTQKVVKY